MRDVRRSTITSQVSFVVSLKFFLDALDTGSSAMSTAYQTIGRDYITFRTVNAKRKTAQEVLNETRALYVKSTPNGTASGSTILFDDDEDKELKKGKRPRTKGGSTLHSGHSVVTNNNFEDELKKLISQESIEVVVCCQDEEYGKEDAEPNIEYNDHISTDISLPASEDCNLLLVESQDHDIPSPSSILSTPSSSSKSYGKPPSINDKSSSSSLGGSYSKVEQKLTDWVKIEGCRDRVSVKQPIKSKTFGSSCELIKSVDESAESSSEGDVASIPTLSPLPDSIEEFFSRLGLSEGDYENLTKNDSRSSSPVYFPSVSSKSSSTSRRWAKDATGTDDENKESVSVVETNARILKWLRSTSKFFVTVDNNVKVTANANS